MIVPLLAALIAGDLASIRTEPLLEKRFERALDNSGRSVDEARRVYDQGDDKGFEAAIEEVQGSVKLAVQTLKDMGKHPSRNVRNYKRAELKVRELLRRIESFRLDVSIDHRDPVDKLRASLHTTHEELLEAVMSRKP
ncbi:MAG: hypothetical protein FJW40_02325 [Acidobacteria bacterium]|nr:hypothetical protein [Acidobacteriota bacterium]